MDKTIYILHSFDGRPYFESVEYFSVTNGYKVKYRETNFIKSIVKVLLFKKCSNCSLKAISNNFIFFLKVPFMRDQNIIYGTGPYDYKFLWYSLLRNRNNFIYHTSHHKWENNEDSVFLYGSCTSFIQYFWKKILLDARTKVVAVTRESKKSFESKFYLSKAAKQIYHSVNTDSFKKLQKKNTKLKILFVGRFVYEKGLDVIVEIIQNSSPDRYEFTFVGGGNYMNKISHIFKKKNVSYLGWISSKRKIIEIYQEHDILLNPSIRNGDWEELFGIVNIEAMAAGLVVIASNHVGPREIICHGKNGFLVEEKRPNLIKDVLNELYLDRRLLAEISKESVKRSKDFSVQTISKQWGDIINEE